MIFEPRLSSEHPRSETDQNSFDTDGSLAQFQYLPGLSEFDNPTRVCLSPSPPEFADLKEHVVQAGPNGLTPGPSSLCR